MRIGDSGSLRLEGWFLIRISLPRLRVLMLSNPLDRVAFRNKALDYFRFAIGPQNIHPPAKSGIFPSHENWSLLEHPPNMRLWCPGSSQLSCRNQTIAHCPRIRPPSRAGSLHVQCLTPDAQ